MNGRESNELFKELDHLYSEYKKDIEQLRQNGALSSSTADASLYHSRNFINWLRDRLDPSIKTEASSVKQRDKRVQVDEELLVKEHKVAYYLSRFEHDMLFPQYTQVQAFEKASKILGVKKSTLKHKRDAFDPFVNNLKTRGNHRRGWWQSGKLSDAMEKVYNRYLHMEEKDIEKEIREILGISL